MFFDHGLLARAAHTHRQRCPYCSWASGPVCAHTQPRTLTRRVGIEFPTCLGLPVRIALENLPVDGALRPGMMVVVETPARE